MNTADDSFSTAVDAIIAKDPRFAKGAYYFVRMGLDHTVKKIQKEKRARPKNMPGHHVSGRELLDGIRELAIEQYGPMAYTLFRRWGLSVSDNFGEIVFNLVEAKILGKTENDRQEDFNGGFSFEEAFVVPYLPAKSSRRASTKSEKKSPPPAKPKRRRKTVK